jgi:hypothetical protein
LQTRGKNILAILAGGLGLLLLAAVTAYYTEGALRGYAVRKMNENLQGYTVQIHRLQFQPVLTLRFLGVTVIQDAFPGQPVAQVERMRVGVHWRDLFWGNLVADLNIRSPILRIDVAQLTHEMEDEVPLDDKGWQEALEEVYPFEINALRVSNGSLTYIEEGFSPVEVSNIELRVENIRNVRRADDVYPSPVQLEATVFERGSVAFDGRARLLTEPHPQFRGEVELRDLDLDYLAPVAQRYGISLRQGILESGEAFLEVSPLQFMVDVTHAVIRGLEADYLYTGDEVDFPEAEETGEEMRIRVGSLQVLDSELGLVNGTESPDYRVFMTIHELEMENLGNGHQEGPGTARMEGAFMGSGHSVLYATVGPENQAGPDFQISLAIENTSMASLSEVAEAHAGLTVAEGTFNFYSEVQVQEGQIDGYVKPMFRDVEIGDEEEDRSFFQRVYEGVADAVVGLLESRRGEVVAVTDISGPVEDPEAGTWQTIRSLLRNAFYEAILPGFEDSSS